MKKLSTPTRDPETGEWRYNGKWYDYYPDEELEADECALDDYWERKRNRYNEDDPREER